MKLSIPNTRLNVLVTGSFDLCHSGHMAFLQNAATFGDVYVGIGSDKSITYLKRRPPICNEQERLYSIKAIRWVKDAWINKGMGMMDFSEGWKQGNPVYFHVFVVSEDQDIPEKREFCIPNEMRYVVLPRLPLINLPPRSSTALHNIAKAHKYFDKVTNTLNNIDKNSLDQIVKILSEVGRRRSTAYICGNGGSGSTASHFANDLSKLAGIKAISLNDNIASLTAYANDMNYNSVFTEPLKILMQSGDILFAISGSGNSANILQAVDYVNSINNITCGLTGFDGGELKKMAKYSINTNIHNMQISEDVHLIVCHLIAQILSDEIYN